MQQAGDGDDAFVALLSSDLTTLIQSTYWGGRDGYEEAVALAIGANGVYVAGYTSSTDFPGTTGGAQQAGDGDDAFVALLSSDLTTLIQSTYLRGSDGYDYAYALAIGANGVYVAGYTYSTDFPGTTGGAQPTGDGDDAFVALLSSDLTTLIQSTYLGGSDGYDYAYALAIGANGVYVAGNTYFHRLPRYHRGCSAGRKW